ncbi:MAG: hypothetical protein Kow0074_22060 [Candidatus Zixiibacteriota bacterium]
MLYAAFQGQQYVHAAINGHAGRYMVQQALEFLERHEHWRRDGDILSIVGQTRALAEQDASIDLT